MHPLDKTLRSAKSSFGALAGGAILAALIFVSMGLTQLGVDFTPSEPPEPLLEFHLPPPPPPPPEREPPPRETAVSINFDLPTDDSAADVPLGFLQVDFGLSPKLLTDHQLNVDDAIDSFATDGLEQLSVYDYTDVTEKPVRTFIPSLNIPPHLIGGGKGALPFMVMMVITAEGRATNVHVMDCEYPEAIPYIVAFVEKIRYRPAKKDGRPVNCVGTFRFTYHPSGGGNPFSL